MTILKPQSKIKLWHVLKLTAICAFLSVSGGKSVMAACSAPVGDEGDQVYNSSFDVMQYCDGTDWTAMRGDNLGNHTATTTLTMGANDITGTGAVSANSFAASGGNAITWENGVNTISSNDGAGNVQIRLGHDFSASDERFTHAGGAAMIGSDIDATSDTSLFLRVSANPGAGDDAPVVWGSALSITDSDVFFGGTSLLNGTGDNLGTHIATTNIQLGSNYLSGDGGNEGVFVDSAGNVGIGTAAPQGQLHVSDGTGNVLVLSSSIVNGSDIYMVSNGVVSTESNLYINIDSNNNETNAAIIIGHNSNTNAATQLVRIQEDGRMGIGGGDIDGTFTITGAPGVSGVNTAGQGAIVLQSDAGASTGQKMRIDTNEIQASSGTSGVSLFLNRLGGDVRLADSGKASVGGDIDGTFTITGAPDLSAINTAGQGGLVIQNEATNASGFKMRIDANEIQSSNNSLGTSLLLNPHGGNVIAASNGTFISETQTILGDGGIVTGLNIRENVLMNAPSAAYDIWIQGGEQTAGGDGRNLAFLGLDEDSGDYLRINFAGEYANGVTIESDVGIGNTDRDGTLTVTGAPEISGVNTAGQGALVLQTDAGNTTGSKMRLDTNEIQVSSGTSGAALLLNPYGGDVRLADSGRASVGGDIDGTFTITGAPDINGINNAGNGALVIQSDAGNTAGSKMRFDTNEIQASSGTSALNIHINPFGGNVVISGSNRGAGNLDLSGGDVVDVGAYFHSSDLRLKKDIETISGLDLVTKLRGVTYKWKDDGDKSAGVIAQEVEKVLPRAVRTDEEGMKSVEYDQLIAPLIEAVKELKAENDALKIRIETLEVKTK